jgi:hypothetical protein
MDTSTIVDGSILKSLAGVSPKQKHAQLKGLSLSAMQPQPLPPPHSTSQSPALQRAMILLLSI